MTAGEEIDNPSNENDVAEVKLWKRGDEERMKRKEGVKCVDRILFIVLSVDSP